MGVPAAAAVAGLAVVAMAGCSSKGSAVAGSGGTSGGGSGGQPPSFSATGPNEYRILPAPAFHAPCAQGDCSVPDVPSLVVKDAKGAQVGLLIDPDSRKDDPKRMQVRICPFSTGGIEHRAEMDKCVIHLVATGDTFTDLGLKVTIGQMWWMSDDKNDALDATITTV